MPIDLQDLRPPPAGFGMCLSCVYGSTGAPELCFACTTRGHTVRRAPSCPVCGQVLDGTGGCPNAVCTLEDRYFDRVYTVSERPDEMWNAVYSYKYGEERGWADVLARILVGFLEENREELQRFEVITNGAIYVGPRAVRLWDYLRLVLDAAGRLRPGLPIAPGLIAKSGPTGRFLGIDPAARRAIAEGELRSALSVPEPDRVAGKRVLVFDDVYSEGYSLREMARVLHGAGAVEVSGLVLARVKGG
jgi:predicted amidophosphoribosyltransferase